MAVPCPLGHVINKELGDSESLSGGFKKKEKQSGLITGTKAL